MTTPTSHATATAEAKQAPRGVISTRTLTAIAIAALALSWAFLPDFTVVIL